MRQLLLQYQILKARVAAGLPQAILFARNLQRFVVCAMSSYAMSRNVNIVVSRFRMWVLKLEERCHHLSVSLAARAAAGPHQAILIPRTLLAARAAAMMHQAILILRFVVCAMSRNVHLH